MDVAKETTIRMLKDAHAKAKTFSWRIDLRPEERLKGLGAMLNQPTGTAQGEEAFKAMEAARTGILQTFEQCRAKSDPVAGLDLFIGLIEEKIFDLGGKPGI